MANSLYSFQRNRFKGFLGTRTKLQYNLKIVHYVRDRFLTMRAYEDNCFVELMKSLQDYKGTFDEKNARQHIWSGRFYAVTRVSFRSKSESWVFRRELITNYLLYIHKNHSHNKRLTGLLISVNHYSYSVSRWKP